MLEKVQASAIAVKVPDIAVTLLPANLDLAGIEAELIGTLRWDQTLKNILTQQKHDVVLIDCPPTLGSGH
jgi:cellulose biosynthesis protein BcsQ